MNQTEQGRVLAISQDATPEWAPQFTVYEERTGARVAAVFGSESEARLIAAAPLLLEALEQIEQDVALMEDTDPLAALALIQSRARAAIRAARGEA